MTPRQQYLKAYRICCQVTGSTEQAEQCPDIPAAIFFAAQESAGQRAELDNTLTAYPAQYLQRFKSSDPQREVIRAMLHSHYSTSFLKGV